MPRKERLWPRSKLVAILDQVLAPDIRVILDAVGVVRGIEPLTETGATFLLHGGAAANLDKPYDDFQSINGICVEIVDPTDYDEKEPE